MSTTIVLTQCTEAAPCSVSVESGQSFWSIATPVFAGALLGALFGGIGTVVTESWLEHRRRTLENMQVLHEMVDAFFDEMRERVPGPAYQSWAERFESMEGRARDFDTRCCKSIAVGAALMDKLPQLPVRIDPEVEMKLGSALLSLLFDYRNELQRALTARWYSASRLLLRPERTAERHLVDRLGALQEAISEIGQAIPRAMLPPEAS